jgi:hypothetical protein
MVRYWIKICYFDTLLLLTWLFSIHKHFTIFVCRFFSCFLSMFLSSKQTKNVLFSFNFLPSRWILNAETTYYLLQRRDISFQDLEEVSGDNFRPNCCRDNVKRPQIISSMIVRDYVKRPQIISSMIVRDNVKCFQMILRLFEKDKIKIMWNVIAKKAT